MSGRGSPGCAPASRGAIPISTVGRAQGPAREGRLSGTLPGGVLPADTLPWCVELLQRVARRLNATAGAPMTPPWVVDRDLVAAHLLAPWVIAAANGLAPPPPPRPPEPAPGGGWVDVDPGPDDHDTWDRFRDVLAREVLGGAVPADAEEMARRAQEWRLPVTPYRTNVGPATPRHPGCATSIGTRVSQPQRHQTCEFGPTAVLNGAMDPGGKAPLAGVTVIDLTVLWAGPLATWLLAGLGARVIKIEPAARPDGLRRGDRPAVAGPGDGALFAALDHGKEHCQLDLRQPVDHTGFLELVRTADVVVDNLSRRVRPNLGIEPERLRRVRPGLIDLSLRAFDQLGPDADWVAHGGGVHAASGLAAIGPDGVPRPTVINYPDPVAGVAAFETLMAALAARDADATPAALSLSLEQAIRPLGPIATPPAPFSEPNGSTTGADGTRTALWRWAMVAAERATVVTDGCRVLPSPILRAPLLPTETGSTP